MADQITPALSAEDWKRVTAGRLTAPHIIPRRAGEGDIDEAQLADDTEDDGEDDFTSFELNGLLSYHGDYASTNYGEKGERSALALMALGNFRLPDGHTQKITREDVERCRSAAYAAEGRLDNEGPDLGLYEEMRAWQALTAKLSALLPPEA